MPESEPVPVERAPSQQPRRTLFTVLAALAILLALTGFVDQAGRDFIESGMKRSLVTFGLARTINGVISVAQGTEVAFEPAGIGVNLAPGEILDPVNDMVERFSWVMLSASASLGLQQLLLDFFEWFPMTMLYVAVCVLMIVVLYSRASDGFKRLMLRLFIVATLIRFFIPVLSLGVEVVHEGFLEPRYQAAMQKLQQSSEAIDQEEVSASTSETEPGDGTSLLDRLKRFYGSAQSSLDVDQRLENLKQIAGEMTASVVELIVIFLFQTLLFPLAAIWGARFVFRSAMRMLTPGSQAA